MVTAGALQVAPLWLLIQCSPLERAIRYVVVQYAQPILARRRCRCWWRHLRKAQHRAGARRALLAQARAEPAPLEPAHPGPFRVQPQRSLSELANEQLRRSSKPRDPFAENVEGAGVDDCMHAPAGTPAVGGLLAAPGLAARALAGRCAK